MPPKEVQLIKPITSKDDFEGVLASEKRLVVLDVYHSWYGPCMQMEPTFKSLASNTDFWEQRGQFYMMDVSVVPEMEEKYTEGKPKAKPMFLFYFGGKQVAEVLGCDAPKILGAIDEFMPAWNPEEE
eukprot:CAMPEP_0178991326 /NCGR_PEP_ID=MMETSP0795-20121207/5457_1 /TAXON_ID=88552 /ORGANISM="Amoebophrya sp., Strain Ameob2" /LENGTH=126 /DNA_ID=CAMNT_0020683005 /DNA_START=105 /DNA_END=485 /DNA_ORIENTATION=+